MRTYIPIYETTTYTTSQVYSWRATDPVDCARAVMLSVCSTILESPIMEWGSGHALTTVRLAPVAPRPARCDAGGASRRKSIRLKRRIIKLPSFFEPLSCCSSPLSTAGCPCTSTASASVRAEAGTIARRTRSLVPRAPYTGQRDSRDQGNGSACLCTGRLRQ